MKLLVTSEKQRWGELFEIMRDDRDMNNLSLESKTEIIICIQIFRDEIIFSIDCLDWEAMCFLFGETVEWMKQRLLSCVTARNTWDEEWSGIPD